MMLVSFFTLLFVALLGQVDATCVDGTVACRYEVSGWSNCDPCKHVKSRSVRIIRARQGSGGFCPNDPVVFEACPGEKVCPEPACKDDALMFTCLATGTCIRPDLVCNGDNDCGDFSDEANCTADTLEKHKSFIEKCVSLPRLQYVDLPMSGFNILTSQYQGKIFDGNYYDGLCRNMFNPNDGKTYRLPYNFNNFHFQTVADGNIKTRVYHNYHDYRKSRESSSDDQFSVGVKYNGTLSGDIAGLSVQVKFTQKRSEQDVFHAMNSSDSSLFHLFSRVQIAEFQLRVDNPMLNPEFRSAITRLPSSYNPKVYTDFINDYGTHYVHAGTLGGQINQYYVVDKSEILSEYSDSETFSKCLNVEASVSIFGVGISGGYGRCRSNNNTIATTDYASSIATNIIHDNVGGTADAAMLFVTQRNSSEATLEKYINSVKDNPTVLTRRMRIICELIPQTGVANYDQIQHNCEMALKDYLSHHSVSGCSQCQNGGMAVKINQTCYCACPSGVLGQLCQLQQDQEQRLNIRSDDPLPFMVRKTTDERGIIALRAQYDMIYALKENGTVNVYTNDPFDGMQLAYVINSTKDTYPSRGFDVGSDGTVWTFDNKTKDLLFTNENNTYDRIRNSSISNFCWEPSDLTTTCDGLLVITDLCAGGRFFVLRHRNGKIAVEQYNDGGSLPEPPMYVSAGPSNRLYFTSSNFITIFEKPATLSPYQLLTSFPHGVQFPRQTFVDETNTIFLSCSWISEGKNTFMAVYRQANATDYYNYAMIKTKQWTGGCSGLTGSGSEIFTSCVEPGLTMFRTI